MESFTVNTKQKTDLINITDEVERIVSKSGVKEGTCLVFVPHATAGVIINENEPNIKQDILFLLERSVQNKEWAHNKIDDNAEAHLKSILVGQGKSLPIHNGKLVRGTWQEIMLCEFDGPRTRRILVLCR
ncbi:MAG: secondary thiamine-phosphate synthase enzyme YjbQ [Candidatus Micrarchaeia archaeon]